MTVNPSLMITSMELNPGERIDDLQIRGLKIIQNPEYFCFGIDAVLLSYYAKVKDGSSCIDLGTGNGVIPLLLSAKTNAKSLKGLEIQKESISLAERSVLLNDLGEKISIIEGDIKNVKEMFQGSSFDVVTTNPPYMSENHGLTNPESVKAIARHEIKCSLEDVISASQYLLRPQGMFYMVHRPHRLVDIFSLMRGYGIEPKRIRFVHPYADKEPNMVLIEGMRGGRPNLVVDPPLVVYDAPGKYTDEIINIYANA